MMQIVVGGQALTLLPDKAAFLPRQHILLVADAHIGKAQSFRALGVPVPEGATHDTLARLSTLIERLQVQRVIFLGDFLHSAHAHRRSTQAALSTWRARHAAIGLTLVRGNHDDRAGDPPPSLGFEVLDEPLMLDGLALVHHPQAK